MHVALPLPEDISDRLAQASFSDSSIGMALIAGPLDEAPEEVMAANQAMVHITGFSEHELCESGARILDLERWALSSEVVRSTDSESSAVEFEDEFERADGSRIWILVTLSPIPSIASDERSHRLAQVQDVTDRRAYQSHLQFLAQHDALTGLANSRRFHDVVNAGITYRRRFGGDAALLSFDIDRFKMVNDTYGHETGDRLLCSFATVLSSQVRESDTVARLGGDEFVVFLPGTDSAGAKVLGDEILTFLRSHPREVDGEGTADYTLSVSGGVAALGDRDRVSAQDLLAEADAGLYTAKRAGRGSIVEFGLGDSPIPRDRQRLTWAERIRRALGHDGLFLEAQPIVSIASGEVVRHEALLRIDDPEVGVVYPSTFLYTAERFGLAVEIDTWVAGRVIEALQASPDSSSRMAFNMTAASLDHTSAFPEALIGMISESGIDPARVSTELTETGVIADLERAREVIRMLREAGCQVAVDDFGAGLGGFSYLKMLPFDTLKIDGQFISGIAQSPRDRVIVKAIADMANGLGLETVAEFVIDEATMDVCRDLGIDCAQGTFISPPVPIDSALGTA